MVSDVFDRETILDITVNLIPLGMLVFFGVMFAVYFPWETGLLVRAVSVVQLVAPFVFLVLVTYLAAKRL